MLEIGTVAPPFVSTSTQGQPFSLVGLRGKLVVLYFYRRAFTPNCTFETKGFRDNYADLASVGAEVVGVSPDDYATQCSFAETHGVQFPLIADSDRSISTAYKVRFALIPTIHRVTYVIDRKGVIAGRFKHEFQVSKHLDEVLRFVRNFGR
ncbi:MAG: peroxiredoxin [Polyangiales bacterium]